jgi:hypothetical protein
MSTLLRYLLTIFLVAATVQPSPTQPPPSAIFVGRWGTRVTVSGDWAMIEIPTAIAPGQAERRFPPLYQSETVYSWIMAANNRMAMKGEDTLTLNEKYLFKRVKLEPGNYRLEVDHRAHGDGFVGSDTVQFAVK